MARTRLRSFDWAGLLVALECGRSDDWGAQPRTCVEAPDLYVGVRTVRVLPAVLDPIEYGLGPRGGRFARSVQVGRRGDDWLFSLQGPAGPDRVGIFDSAFRQGEVLLSHAAAARGAFPLAYPLDELVLIHRLSRQGGLVVEGVAFRRGARAVVVLGGTEPPGDAGWERLSGCLGGQRVVLRLQDGAVRVHGRCEDGGPIVRPVSLRLDAIYTARPTGCLDARAASGVDAAQGLLAHVVAPPHDPEGAERALAWCERVAQRVACVQLQTALQPSTAPLEWDAPRASFGFAPPVL